MTKKEARQQVKEWMKKLDKNYIEKADQSIFEQVKELKIKEPVHKWIGSFAYLCNYKNGLYYQ